jgi:hypothetical protein
MMSSHVTKVRDRNGGAAGGMDEESHLDSSGCFFLSAHLRRDIFIRTVPAVGVSGSGSLHRPWSGVVFIEFLDRGLDREKGEAEQVEKMDCHRLSSSRSVLFPDCKNSESIERSLSEERQSTVSIHFWE